MKELKLAELEEMTGVPARTIRLYITRGLIPGPLRAGRNAAYGMEHVKALREVVRMQQQGMSLEEIRRKRAGGRNTSSIPEPLSWQSYAVAPEVAVMVRGDVGGWRMRQIQKAIATMMENLGDESEKEE